MVKDTLASHLSPSLAPSWKSRALLTTKPSRTTSALIGKSYIAAGQAGMARHTMAILQAYQADVLEEMDEGTGLTPEAVKELRRATDLALRATKHTAGAVGRLWQVQWPQSAICGSISLRFVRKKRCSCWTHPSHNLGYLERQLALWWRNFAPLRRSWLLLSSLCLGGRGTTPLPPLSCLESNPYPERSLLAGAAPRLHILPRLRSGEPVAGLFLANDHADGLT